GRSLQFIAAPLPRGFVEVAHAPQVNLGAHIDLGLRWGGVMPSRVQLLDAAGEVLAEQMFDAEAALSSATAALPAAASEAQSSSASATSTASAQASAASAAGARSPQALEAAASERELDAALTRHAGILPLQAPARAAGALTL